MARQVVIALGASATLLPGAACAHDTWLERRPHAAGWIELALTSGELFPIGQTPVSATSLVDRGCQAINGRRVALQPGAESASALALRATDKADGAPVQTCWVQTESFDLDLAPALVPLYLREIAAPDSVRQAWAEHQKQGLPWRERYTKHARISFPAPAALLTTAPAAAPPLAMDIEVPTASTLQAGQTIAFRVLRDGQPLAGQAVELRGDASRVGLWRRTDAEGRASVQVPFAGRWVLRATDLRPVPGRAGHWESRFATHTFAAAERAAGPAHGASQPPNQRATP